jgi:hypothetical protein
MDIEDIAMAEALSEVILASMLERSWDDGGGR